MPMLASANVLLDRLLVGIPSNMPVPESFKWLGANEYFVQY